MSKSWKHFRKKIYIGFQIHHVLDKPVVDICIVFVMSIAYRNSIIALLLCDMGPSLDLVMSSENPLPKRGHHFDICNSSFCPCYTSYQGSLWALSLAIFHFQTQQLSSGVTLPLSDLFSCLLSKVLENHFFMPLSHLYSTSDKTVIPVVHAASLSPISPC